MKNNNTARFIVVFAFILLFYITLLAQLFYWQILRQDELRTLGEAQSTTSIDIPAKRGEILTNDGFPITTNTISYLAYINPKLITDKKRYAQQIADVLDLDEASISAKLNSNLFWVKLANTIEPEKKIKLEKLSLAGIGFEQEPLRFYPEGSMAAHLVGFLGKDDQGQDKGYFGVEGYYDEQLRGRDGRMIAIRDALGNAILNDIREEAKIDGRSLKLTIDRSIQFMTEKHLKKGIEQYDADSASVVVMDSKTGAILAMSTFPQFDPQTYWEFSSSTYKNPVISSLYEPGSTFKALIMASAIENGVVKPDTKCNICSGPITIGNYTIETWNKKYFPNTTMTEVIEHSDNTGMVFVGQKLGLNNLLSYLQKFGIGYTTGIDLQGEVTGNIRQKEDWSSIDIATASFGQGISITPIQLVTAVNAIANSGTLMKPFVVSKIIEEDGKVIEIKPKVVREVISEATSRAIAFMMVNAVENGEAKWTKIDNYEIAGKTGTAQIPVAGHYDPNQTIASFVGFFPANDPKITMLVLFNKPKTSIYGSETAAPVFFAIARDILKYYNIAPKN